MAYSIPVLLHQETPAFGSLPIRVDKVLIAYVDSDHVELPSPEEFEKALQVMYGPATIEFVRIDDHIHAINITKEES